MSNSVSSSALRPLPLARRRLSQPEEKRARDRTVRLLGRCERPRRPLGGTAGSLQETQEAEVGKRRWRRCVLSVVHRSLLLRGTLYSREGSPVQK